MIHIAVVLAALAGMRLGEVCALRWEDVNLEGGTLLVRRSLQHTQKAGLQFKGTKSGTSRLVPLPARAVAELRCHREEQDQRRALLGTAWQENDLVFPNDDGTPRNPNQASKTFHDFIRRTDLPSIRFHDLRHTHATLLGHAKVTIKVAQERLGHKTLAITADLYTQVFATARDEAAEALERLLSEK